jgi:peptidoglycan/LPS O-acetylase OafA/YrhL
MSQSNKIFFPNLEGLRFFAFFIVFINHATICLGYNNPSENFKYVRSHFLQNGDLGVSFFFVLSGFLITYLLLKEKELSGKINIKKFYLRRVLRIWPLYFLVVFLCLIIFPMLSSIRPAYFPIRVDISKLNPWFYLTFTGNFDYLTNGITNVLIGVLWSVSIEEQFYLFWPLIIALTPTKHLLKVFIILIFGSIAFRFFYAQGNALIIKYHSLSSLSDLTTGASIAYLSTKDRFLKLMARTPKYAIIIVYSILIILLLYRINIWKLGIYYNAASSILPVIFSSIFAFIILEQNYAEHSFYKISNSKTISSFGKYTYGMYCYHMLTFFSVLFIFYLMGIDIMQVSKYTFVFAAFTSLCSTMLISQISYYYFESFFLRLKTKFAF